MMMWLFYKLMGIEYIVQLGFTWMELPTEVNQFAELKLTHFKSIHDWFILVTEINRYKIIKISKLKVSIDKSLWET
jgi:hypothetical protein